MQKKRLGRTELMVSEISFGALPIQRVDFDTARAILRRAFACGVNFFDTARGYTDSEEKIGYSLSDVREQLYLATKSPSRTRAGVLQDIETSLRLMKTDHVDLLQLHNPPAYPDPDDPESAYAGLIEAQRRGLTRFIGITVHKLPVARQALASGLYDTIQYPYSYLASEEEHALVTDCAAADVGFIAMKALAGGLISNARAAYAFMSGKWAVPIFGIQRMEELDAFLRCADEGVTVDEALLRVMEEDRKMLAGSFCRSCGYCLPCPAGIPIPNANRMSLLLRRSPSAPHLSAEMNEKMHLIEHCIGCNQCSAKCPYGIDVPTNLKRELADYVAFRARYLAEHPEFHG